MKRLMLKRKTVFGLVLMCFGFLLFLSGYKAKAEETVSVTEIDYDKSIIVVRLGNGDTELQISDSQQKTWESVSVEPVSGSVTMDISWIPISKDYVLSLRGDKNKTAVKVKIPKQEKTLKVSYTPSNENLPLNITGNNGRTIQWKKKNSTKWKTYNAKTFKGTLDSLVCKGGVLMFRTAPVKGNAESSGMRPGKEVSVTIKAKGAAPKVTIDDEKLTFSLQKGLEYRFCDEDGKAVDGTAGEWKAITSIPSYGDVPIKLITPKALASGGREGVTVGVQFRIPAKAKKQVSNTTTVFVPGQKRLSLDERNSVIVEYYDKNKEEEKNKYKDNFKLQFTAASYSNPYEYCIINAKDIKEGVTIESYNELKWITVTDTKQFNINKSKDKATDGSRIYIRKKALRKLGVKDYALASTAELIAVVKYPD